MTCSKCGSEQVECARFCNNCGAELMPTDNAATTPLGSVSASQVPDNPPKQPRPRDYLEWLGVIVAVGPVVGYSMAFLQELGFCSYFKIPSDFIQLNLTKTLIAVGQGLGLALVISLFLLWYYVSSGAKGLSPGKSKCWYGLVLLSTAFYICWVSGLNLLGLQMWEILGSVTALIVASFVLEWGFRRIKRRRSKSEERENRIPEDAVRDFLVKHLGAQTVFLVVFLAVIAFVEPWFIGHIRAINQVDFMQPSDNTSRVVLRVYGDDLIWAPVDNKTVQANFSVIKMDDDPRPVFTIKSIGPLKPSGT